MVLNLFCLIYPLTKSKNWFSDLINHSQIACGFVSFSIAKATHEDASNANVSSETNPNIGRVPTARNREQLVCKDVWFSCTWVRWREAKWAYKIDGFVEPSPTALAQKLPWGLWIIICFMMNSNRSPGMVLVNLSSSTHYLKMLKSSIVNSWITRSLKRPPLCWLSTVYGPGADPGGRLGRSPRLKPTKVTLFTMISYNSEKSTRDTMLFCLTLFGHIGEV